VTLNRRKLLDHALRVLTGLCAAIACSILGVIVFSIVNRGWSAISLKFFTEQIRLVGADGGIFYNLVGTGILMVTAFALSAPLAICLALTYTVGLKGTRIRSQFSLLLYVLNGVPSILFGIFGMIIFVGLMGLGKSWLVGGILLGFMILPTVTVSLIERMGAIPRAQFEAAAALGLHKSQIIRSVVLPQSFGGLITGSLLGLARAAGETAPIMFTATVFAGATIPAGIKESPVLSLPYHIFILAQDSFDPAVGAKLWGTALTLLFLVAVLSLIALPMRLKIHQPAHHD
jgi:phosphate transport system permease protein